MGFVVLHIQKAKGNDAGTSSHIERTIHPANADESRMRWNRELVDLPDGVKDRTAAIQHRLNTAGLTRKIGTNQVRALRLMLSCTPEDMQRIQNEGQLEEWSKDNVDWLKKTFGADNLVAATLHLDEKTPHIHATVVPIVAGERRKAKEAKAPEPGKKQYRKKNTATPRLCADDVMARDKLKGYQDTYAEAMAKYGLKRGIEGSEARHISNLQYYRDLEANKQDLEEHVEALQEQKEEVNDKIWDLYDRKDEARDRFIDMDRRVNQKRDELIEVEAKLEIANRELSPDKLREDFNLLRILLPQTDEVLRIGKLCQSVGFSQPDTVVMINGQSVPFSGLLYSQEYNRTFQADNATAKIEKDTDKAGRFCLTINGINIIDWFKQKFEELQRVIRPHVKPIPPTAKKGRGL